MDHEAFLKQVKSLLRGAFGARLRGVVLYGSEARGTAQPDSDIDVLVLLTGPLRFADDLRTCIHVLYPLVLELGRPIDVIPADADEYDSGDWPLYQAAKSEGIPV